MSLARPRALVTGASGQLGAVMCAALPDHAVTGLRHAELDIADPHGVRDVVADLAPAVIINCAAFNDVDGAEEDAPTALAVNALAVRSLARAAETVGATLVHFSSDFFFDGERAGPPYREEDPTSPRSIYASSKLMGEWFALDAPSAYVLRVESLFGCGPGWTGRRGTLDSLVRRMAAGEPVRVFTDRVVSPSRLQDVAAAVRHLLATGAPGGLYHCVNSGNATWQDVAAHAAAVLGLSPSVELARARDVRTRARRPLYCALDNAKLAAAGFRMPDWRDAVGAWLGEAGRPTA